MTLKNNEDSALLLAHQQVPAGIQVLAAGREIVVQKGQELGFHAVQVLDLQDGRRGMRGGGHTSCGFGGRALGLARARLDRERLGLRERRAIATSRRCNHGLSRRCPGCHGSCTLGDICRRRRRVLSNLGSWGDGWSEERA